jgi:hypothetical protein
MDEQDNHFLTWRDELIKKLIEKDLLQERELLRHTSEDEKEAIEDGN